MCIRFTENSVLFKVRDCLLIKARINCTVSNADYRRHHSTTTNYLLLARLLSKVHIAMCV